VGVEPGDALGHVIAHELGHLLLKGEGHASNGVMQPGYEFRNRSAQRFTPEQAVMLRQEMQRRR
jgi:Zn-dependent peptidase ImmA (M78 family)